MYRDRRSRRPRWARCPWVRGPTWRSNPEHFAQTVHDPGLRARTAGRDEDRVVSGERADDLGPLRFVDGDRDALRRAGRSLDHRQARARASDLLDELCKSVEFAVGAHNVRGRKYVATARLQHSDLAHIAADRRLG